MGRAAGWGAVLGGAAAGPRAEPERLPAPHHPCHLSARRLFQALPALQRSPHPLLSSSSRTPGAVIGVSLEGSGFHGFALQARSGDGGVVRGLGEFGDFEGPPLFLPYAPPRPAPDLAAAGKYDARWKYNCLPGRFSVTHSGPEQKTSLNLLWGATDDVAEPVHIMFTIIDIAAGERVRGPSQGHRLHIDGGGDGAPLGRGLLGGRRLRHPPALPPRPQPLPPAPGRHAQPPRPPSPSFGDPGAPSLTARLLQEQTRGWEQGRGWEAAREGPVEAEWAGKTERRREEGSEWRREEIEEWRREEQEPLAPDWRCYTAKPQYPS